MKTKTSCMYELPHELTGIGSVCGLFKNVCNGYGKDCIGYKRHTNESRAKLEKAIAEVQKRKEEHKEGNHE